MCLLFLKGKGLKKQQGHETPTMSEPNRKPLGLMGNDSNRAWRKNYRPLWVAGRIPPPTIEQRASPVKRIRMEIINQRDEANLLKLLGLPECIIHQIGYTLTDRFTIYTKIHNSIILILIMSDKVGRERIQSEIGTNHLTAYQECTQKQTQNCSKETIEFIDL